MTITWRNVSGPNLTGAANIMNSGLDAVNKGAAILDKTIQKERDNATANIAVETKNNTEAELSRIAALQTADEAYAAQDSGAFDTEALKQRYGAARIDTGLVAETLKNRPKNLFEQEIERATAATNAETEIRNAAKASAQSKIELSDAEFNQANQELSQSIKASKLRYDAIMTKGNEATAEEQAEIKQLEIKMAREQALYDSSMQSTNNQIDKNTKQTQAISARNMLHDEPYRIEALNLLGEKDFNGARSAAALMKDRNKVLNAINLAEQQEKDLEKARKIENTEERASTVGTLYLDHFRSGTETAVSNLTALVASDALLQSQVKVLPNGRIELLGDLANPPKSFDQRMQEALESGEDLTEEEVAAIRASADTEFNNYTAAKDIAFGKLSNAVGDVPTLSSALDDWDKEAIAAKMTDEQRIRGRESIIQASKELLMPKLDSEQQAIYNEKFQDIDERYNSEVASIEATYQSVLERNPVNPAEDFKSEVGEVNEVLAELQGMRSKESIERSFWFDKDSDKDVKTAELRQHIGEVFSSTVEIRNAAGEKLKVNPRPYHIELATKMFLKNGGNAGDMGRGGKDKFNELLKEVIEADPNDSRRQIREAALADKNRYISEVSLRKASAVSALTQEAELSGGVISMNALWELSRWGK